MLLLNRGRICGVNATFTGNRFVEAVTGALMPRAAVYSPALDTSGALVWRDENRALLSGGSPSSMGRVLSDVACSEYVYCFRYGVCAVRRDDQCCLLRFDIVKVVDAVEPARKVRSQSAVIAARPCF